MFTIAGGIILAVFILLILYLIINILLEEPWIIKSTLKYAFCLGLLGYIILCILNNYQPITLTEIRGAIHG